MSGDKEWFCGSSVDEPIEERCSPHRFAAVLFVAGLVVAAFLAGCAQAQWGAGGGEAKAQTVAVQVAPTKSVDVPVHVYDSDAFRAQLLATPCEHPRVMQQLIVGMPTVVKRFRRVEADFKLRNGEWKHFTGCWAELTKDEVGFTALALLFEDGDFYLVDKAELLAGKGKDT